MLRRSSRRRQRAADAWKPECSIIAGMTISAAPRRLVTMVLARFGLDGGNARALANARGILDGLETARLRVDALEVRIAHAAPASLGVGWPVSPWTGQPARPAAVAAAPLDHA